MSLFYYHLLGLNNRYTLRENGRLVTYSYVHSLVITKIRKITNFENVFIGLLRDTLRDKIDPSSWRFEFLPFRYERDERADDTVGFLTCLSNDDHVECIRLLDGLRFADKYISVKPNTFCNDRFKYDFYVDSKPQRDAVAAWVRANYDDGQVNRPQNQFDEQYDRHHNYFNAPTYNVNHRFYFDHDTPERLPRCKFATTYTFYIFFIYTFVFIRLNLLYIRETHTD
jgi:hypothetical protein